MDRALHMRLLYHKLLNEERPPRDLITGEYVNPQHVKLDIHHAVIKKNAVPGPWQANPENFIWHNSPENCRLLPAKTHQMWGQNYALTMLHVWDRLQKGYEMAEWFRKGSITYYGTVYSVTLNALFKEKGVLKIEPSSLAGHNKNAFPAHAIVWAHDAPFWSYVSVENPETVSLWNTTQH